MRALVVGLGSIGRRHARNWAALGLGDVWVCRRAPSAAVPEGIAARQFDRLDDALAAQPDVVVVCNPTSLHVPTALAAVRAGCHVLVEKPLGASLAGVADLLQASARHGRHVMVGYNLRFHPLLARARALLLSGAIGRPVSARAEAGEYLPDWHPWEDYQTGYSARRDLGGGPILTLSHELDSLCWLMGQPDRLACLAGHTSSLMLDTEDVAEISLAFASGALGTVHVDYVRRPPRRYLEVVGDDGVLRWEYDENRLAVYAAGSRQWRIEEGDPAFTRNSMFLDELRHFAACARGEVPRPLIDGRQGAAVLTVALAALQAAADGCLVDLAAPDGPEGAQSAAWLNSLALPARG